MKRSPIALSPFVLATVFATVLATGLTNSAAHAADRSADKATTSQADTLKFSFANEDINKMIETYSLATGQRFIIETSVKGRATILAADNVSKDEAFNLLSDALALNGFAIRNQGDTMIVQPARTAARSQMEVSTTLPAAKPERMVTYIIPLKYVSATYVNRTNRILPSKDGEMNANDKSNSVTIIDWSSNVQRIDQILKEIDKPIDPKIAKMVDTEHKQWLKERPPQMPHDSGPHDGPHDGPSADKAPGKLVPPPIAQ